MRNNISGRASEHGRGRTEHLGQPAAGAAAAPGAEGMERGGDAVYISVMICDDLEEERAALARMVRQYCQRCALELRLDVASSGEELLDRWTLGQWDLVFLEYFDKAAHVGSLKMNREIYI